MRILLHILTRPENEFITEIIQQQEAAPDSLVRRFALTNPEPDYDQLLLELFRADSTHVW